MDVPVPEIEFFPLIQGKQGKNKLHPPIRHHLPILNRCKTNVQLKRSFNKILETVYGYQTKRFPEIINCPKESLLFFP